MNPSKDRDELVAAKPGERAMAVDERGQSLRDGHEELVTGGVPDSVVDDLEPVEIEEEQGYFRSPRLAQDRLEPVDAQAAVGQAGERVIEGEVLQLSLSRLLGGDIKLNPLPELRAVARVLDHDRHIAQPDDPPIPRHDAIFRAERIARCRLPERSRLGRAPDHQGERSQANVQDGRRTLSASTQGAFRLAG